MAAEQAVAADRLAACEIGQFLRFGICLSPKRLGVGEGRKPAAEPQAVGRQFITSLAISMAAVYLLQTK